MAESLGPLWRHIARVARGERAIDAGARAALDTLTTYIGRALTSSGYDAGVLDAKSAGWDAAVRKHIVPAVGDVFGAGFAANLPKGVTAAAPALEPGDLPNLNPSDYAGAHLATVRNRLAGVPDEQFDLIRGYLNAGRAAGESIPQLAERVDRFLTDEQRWANRATTIARTEVVGAANAGARGAAGATAELLGYTNDDVAKSWLSTGDSRTRETHLAADGQQVIGLDTPFNVGGADLDVPGDPNGDPGEVINCRCTVTFSYPGDPDYPGDTPATTATTAADQGAAYDAPDTPSPALGLVEGLLLERAAATLGDLAAPATAPAAVAVGRAPVTAVETAMRSTPAEQLATIARNGTTTQRAAARAEMQRRGLVASATNHQEAAMTENATEQEEHTGVVLVALPAADDPVQNIGPESPKHQTLLWFGSTDPADEQANPGLTEEFRTILSELCATVAGGYDPVSATVTGVESLGDDGARVWMTDDVLASVRDALTDARDDVEQVRNSVEQFPSWTPHVTIGYPEPGEEQETPTALDPEVEDAAAAVTTIGFDRIALWWGGEQTEWPLAIVEQERADEEPAPTADDVQAALATLARFTSTNLGLVTASTRITAADEPLADDLGEPTTPDATGPAPADMATDGQPFYGILWPEDTMSGDGRMIAAGATSWRDLPLSLHYQDAIAMGHDGAVRVGRIDTIERDETTYPVPVLRYAGVWDTSPTAAEAARQVGEGIVRGVSVDGVSLVVELRDSQGQPLDPMVDDFPEDGVVIEAATEVAVGGATICSLPAFHQAYIANGSYADRTDPEPGWVDNGSGSVPEANTPAEGQDPDALAASAWSLVASARTVWASSDFANPGLTEPTRMTITDDGRVFGHLATWGTCHIGVDGICQEPPASATRYAYFATGHVDTDNGLQAVGQLTMGTGHASMSLRHQAASAHYDNTGSAVADVAMGQDEVGIWFAGRLRPGTTPEQVYAMRAAGSVSGDWREVGGGLELVAALVVNVPGFPIATPSVAASGARATALVASGIVRPARAAAPAATAATDLDAVVAGVVAALDRRQRGTIATTRLRTVRAATAARRLTAQAERDRTTRVAAAVARLNRGE